MHLKELKKSGLVIFEAVVGSRAYGLNTPESDVDIRGIFVQPMSERLSLYKKVEEVSDSKEDVKFYELAKFMHLAAQCNPNIIELFWLPEDCVRFVSPLMEKLIAHRDMFISQRAFHTFTGYAYSQIKKARGKNKMVVNPQPEERPVREDYCWFVPMSVNIDTSKDWVPEFPWRPVPLKRTDIDLRRCHASSLEHADHVYRLYDYGGEARGVFRGDDTLVCESIPKDDEWDKFLGLLIYDKNQWARGLKEWKTYWEWKRDRNEARWLDQEGKENPFDRKNMMHCMRLLFSGENVLKHGEPIVRFEGEQLEYLRAIRRGEFDYEELIDTAERRIEDLKALKEATTIRHHADVKAIDRLFREIVEEFTDGTG